MIPWKDIILPEQIEEIIEQSFSVPQFIYKHSTRCSISDMALSRIERQWDKNSVLITPHFLDLLTYRNLSNAIVEKFKVIHQSPQVLLIINGSCVYNTSHNDINLDKFNDFIAISKNA